MERAPPIDVQLARLPGPEERGDGCCGHFNEQEVGVGSGVEGRGNKRRKGRKEWMQEREMKREREENIQGLQVGGGEAGASGSEEVGCRC